MIVSVVTPPERLISLDDAKAHLRVDDDAEDTLIEAFIDAAQGHIDGPDGWLGRSIGEQTLEAQLAGFCPVIELPFGPVISVNGVAYIAPDGSEQTVAAEDYELFGNELRPRTGFAWPVVASVSGPVRITYTAGFDPMPAPVGAALRLMVGDLFENRASVAPGARPKVEMSVTIERLLSLYKVWRV